MAGSGNFCLRLNEFDGNAKIYWKELQNEKDFCDVTLACDDKQIKSHKLVISSCSPVLRNILKLNQAPHPIIYLRRVSYSNLQNLLNFMYQGEVNVAEEDLPSFLEVAEDLNVRGLFERNTDSFDSERGDPSLFTNQNVNPSPNSKRTSKIEKGEKSNSQKTEFENSPYNFISNYKGKETLSIPNEIIKELADQDSAEEDNKNVISTVAHIQLVHEGLRYPCDQCGYKAKYNSHLKNHVKSIHEGESYECNQCEYKASWKKSIRRHMMKMH